jgi:hypothetical protein
MQQLKNVKIKLCDYIKQENKMQQDFISYRLSSKKPLQQESKIFYYAKAIKNESNLTPSPGGVCPLKFDPLPRGGMPFENCR